MTSMVPISQLSIYMYVADVLADQWTLLPPPLVVEASEHNVALLPPPPSSKPPKMHAPKQFVHSPKKHAPPSPQKQINIIMRA